MYKPALKYCSVLTALWDLEVRNDKSQSQNLMQFRYWEIQCGCVRRNLYMGMGMILPNILLYNIKSPSQQSNIHSNRWSNIYFTTWTAISARLASYTMYSHYLPTAIIMLTMGNSVPLPLDVDSHNTFTPTMEQTAKWKDVNINMLMSLCEWGWTCQRAKLMQDGKW